MGVDPHELLQFLLPTGFFHSKSTARLYMFAECGPTLAKVRAAKAETERDVRFRSIMPKAKERRGSAAHTAADYVTLCNFAVRVPAPLLDNLCQAHFAVIPAAPLRIRPADFGAAAKADATRPYINVSLITSSYLGAIQSVGGRLWRQSGGVAAFAPGLRKHALMKIAENQAARDAAASDLQALVQAAPLWRNEAPAQSFNRGHRKSRGPIADYIARRETAVHK